MPTAGSYLSRDDLRLLRQRSDWRGAWMVVHAWGLIFGAMALFAWWPNPLTFLLAVMIVGARQLGLGILMHDGAHGLLFHDRRINDWVGNWLCAYPVALTGILWLDPLLAALTAVGKPHYYLLFWVLPLVTWRMWVTRLRNIAEHAVVRDNNDPLLNARTTIANPLERLFIAPYYVNYHLEHHLYMWIPCYNLPKAHKLFRQKGLEPRMEVRRGYADVLRLAVKPG